MTENNWTRRDFLATATIGGVAMTAGMGGFSFEARAESATSFLSKGKISFGTILPLSGGFTVVSQPWIHAIKYAIDEINTAGGVKIDGKSYQVDNPVGDEQYSAQGGLTAFKKLAADNTHFTAGYVSVEAPAAVQGVNEQEDHLMILGITGKNLCLTKNKLRFYEYALAQATGPYMAHYAYNVLKVRKIGSIELANTWGEDFYFSFKKTFEALGGQMVSRGFLQPNQTDFSAQITEMASKGVDALYIIMGDGPASAVALQARQGGLADIPILAQGAWGPEMYLEDQGKKTMDGAVYPGVVAYSQWSDKHQKLNDKLFKDTKLYLNNWFWHGYDPTKIVLWAMEEANSLDPRKVIEAIPDTVKKRKSDLMVQPAGTIKTASKGIYLKIPMTIGRFNANADFAKGPALIAVKDKMYNGFPGWVPEKWEGYTADPSDTKVNWYPTLDELKAMNG
jgi:branched-chain amino acid transport system substrate-binding protein